MKFKVVGAEKLVVPDVKQDYHINPLDNFKWVAGADVQGVWRKYGWTPPSELLPSPPPEKARVF